MKKFTKILTTALAAAVAFASIPALPAIYTEDIVVASAAITPTTPTGYDSADDVQYVTAGGYTVNWGAREEECTFLTTKAQAFYGNYFDTWSKLGGNSNTSSTPTSDLYQALKSYMSSKHKNINNYDKNKETARYTDCVLNGYDKYISSFYSGKQIGPSWDGTWNREHTWPNSKGSGSAENDVMMIRPTSTSENSSRGNTAYGEGGAYYHPNSESNGTFDLRGDCARIVLYVYTRWGNTSNMWGTSGVMESKEVLLKWMKEDPVDTWEMGRNDSVQSITGTRNVFVDYPELAWLLFSQDVPTGINTPSGIANGGVVVPPVVNPDDGGDDNTGGSTTPDTPTVDANNPESILKAAYALNAGEVLGTYSLTGKITNVKERDSSTKNICLTFVVDGYDEYPMYCHWLQQGYDLNVGDTITVSGEIKNYNGTIEFNKPNFTLVGSSGGTTTPDSGSGSTGGGSTVDPELPDDGGSTTPAGAVATFDFGAKGGSLNEGTEATSQTYTDGNYQLKITNGVKFYINARDSQGNACLKVGSSKAIGSFTFTVPSDVTSVTFHVAKYKANNSAVTINGEKFTPTGSSNDGIYEEFTVDTTTQKTVNVSTVSGSTRVMIDKIVFLAATTTPDDNTGGGTTTPDSGTTTPDSGSENNTPVQGEQTDGGCASTIGGVGLGALLVCAVALLKKKRS